MTQIILQNALPFIPWMDPRTAKLPGILPVEGDDWLRVDDAFAAQMAERDRLIATQEDAVHGMLERARPAAEELLDRVLDKLRLTPGYRVGTDDVTRPDGVCVAIDRAWPLRCLGRLVQEDLCLMEEEGGEHLLTGAVLCFPASWTLAEKLGRSMLGIHQPVDSYSEDVAKRVQRLFHAIRPEQPLWRMNFHVYESPALFHPRPENDPRHSESQGAYLRSERQCLLRLPQSKAVLFSIHTYLVRIDSLDAAARGGLVDLGRISADAPEPA